MMLGRPLTAGQMVVRQEVLVVVVVVMVVQVEAGAADSLPAPRCSPCHLTIPPVETNAN